MDYAPEPVLSATQQWWVECFPQHTKASTPAGGEEPPPDRKD